MMGNSNKPDNSVEIRQYPASVTCLVMEKYRLINLIDSIKNNQKPNWCALSIPSGIFIGVLPSLLTNSFDDWLNVPKYYWWSFFCLLFFASVLALIVMLIKCFIEKSKYDKRDASRIFEELIQESEVKSSTTSTSVPSAIEFEKKQREREISNYFKLLNMNIDDLDPAQIRQGQIQVNSMIKKQ